MGRKIICESCQSTFKEEMLQDTSICPICGASLDGEGDENISSAKDLIYFDEINTSYHDRPEYNGVSIYCIECNTMSSIKFNQIDKIKDQEFVIVKDGITIKCRGCGKIHENRKIKFRKSTSSAPPLPQALSVNLTC